jgi:guanylate kinase
MTNKPTIIAIIGRSGSGKTYMADLLEKRYEIPMIRSYTTRPKRFPEEDSHTFLTDEEFDMINDDEMIAYTEFGDNRYCCIKSDVKDGVNSYVIDEAGIVMLRANYKDMYNIVAVKIERLAHTLNDIERAKRDDGRFFLPDIAFDYIIKNDGSLRKFQNKIDGVLNMILGCKCDCCDIGGCECGEQI